MAVDDDELTIRISSIDRLSPEERQRQLRELLKQVEQMKQKRMPLEWQCPACQRIYGPKARECWVCNARKSE